MSDSVINSKIHTEKNERTIRILFVTIIERFSSDLDSFAKASSRYFSV